MQKIKAGGLNYMADSHVLFADPLSFPSIFDITWETFQSVISSNMSYNFHSLTFFSSIELKWYSHHAGFLVLSSI